MQRTLILALFAGFTVLAFAKPALAVPSTTTSQFNETNATGVIYVGRNDRNWRNKNYKRNYSGYSYRSRPYNRGYSSYRPYVSQGYPYYYRRPGISLGLAF
jgi:hypothetical protein